MTIWTNVLKTTFSVRYPSTEPTRDAMAEHSNASKSSTTDSKKIIVFAVSGLIIILLCICICCLLYRRKSRVKPMEQSSGKQSKHGTSSGESGVEIVNQQAGAQRTNVVVHQEGPSSDETDNAMNSNT